MSARRASDESVRVGLSSSVSPSRLTQMLGMPSSLAVSMSWNRLWATWTWFVPSAPVCSRNTSQWRLAGLYEPISEATIDSLKGDADGDHRGVDQVAIGVGEDRELPAAVARFGERGGHVVEDGPGRKRASERAGLSFGESQTLLLRETLESEREHFAIGGARLRCLNLGLELVEAGEQAVGVLDAEHVLELVRDAAVPVHERSVAVECRPALSHAAKPRCSLVTACH